MKTFFFSLWLALSALTCACNTVTHVVTTSEDSVENSLLPKITISQATLKAQKDVSKYLQGRINSATGNTAFILPEGSYSLATRLDFTNKTVSFIGGGGVSGLKTIFFVYDPAGAIFFTRNIPDVKARFENLHLINGINDSRLTGTQHAIEAHAPVFIQDCIIENFYGDGISLSANGGSGRPEDFAKDVSFTWCARNIIRSCRGNGITIQGGDANAGTFLSNDIRDCYGYGVADLSFLGNHWISIMCHMNRKGNYIAADPNNCAQFTGCYSEGGSPLSFMDGSARIEGGLWDGGVILEANATANLFGKQLTSKTEAPHIYKRVHFELVDDHYFSIWVRNGNQFQWRLYGKNGLGAIQDKSDRDFSTLQEAITDVKSNLISK